MDLKKEKTALATNTVKHLGNLKMGTKCFTESEHLPISGSADN